MDTKQLLCFVTIVNEGTISKAAKKLCISQPPLSFLLKKLEDELGVKLIERGARSVSLTSAGKVLYNRATAILALTDSTQKEMFDLKNGLTGTLRLGTVSTSGTALLNNRINTFHEKFPNVQFEIYEKNTYELTDLLKNSVIEIAIVRTPFNSDDFNCYYLHKEPMIVIGDKKYFTTITNIEHAKYITIDNLNNLPLIIYRRFKNIIEAVCEESNFVPNVFCLNDDARTTISWANHGLGVAVVPKSALNIKLNKNIIYKEINCDKLNTQITAICKKNSYLSNIAKNFLELF